MSERPNGSFSRVLAALLALALLALPGAPIRHAQAAAPSPQCHMAHQHMAHHCATDAEAAPAPASIPEERGHPGNIPGLTCCLSAQCPMSAATPPPAATALLPRPGPATRFAATSRLWLGIEFPPALPPPRAA